ncbi:MAG: glycosyltransferase [Planctomycetes bacterium]|nr:glycosyltransferase [Planctomycetota bacterium]
MATWYVPGCAVASDSAVELGPWDLLFAPSRGARKEMVASGAPAGRIELCEAAADDTVFYPIHHGTDKPEPQASACATPPESDVAVLMDLPDDRAESCGIALVSHVALWRALQDAASRQADVYEASKAGEWLDEAQTRSGVALQDEQIRQRFLTLIRTCIAPVAIGQAAVQSARRSGCRVAVWGMNWPACADERITVCGRIPTDAQLNEVFNATRIVVLPEASDPSIQTGLNALAAGARVIYRASSQAFATDHPGLASLQPFFHPYRTGSELTAKVRSLLSESQMPPNETEAARRMIHAGHTIAHRLQAMYKRIYAMRVAPTQEPLCGRS